MQDMLTTALPFLEKFGGVLLMLLGLSFGYKFFMASMMGKMTYWAGLEQFGWYFAPMTILVTPLFVHTPPKSTNLIKTKTAGWIHLVWGPVFFLLSLMMLVAGADYLGLPGTQCMNMVLTCGRTDVPPAIIYQPPFSYKFPIIKRARKTIFKILTADIKMDKNKSMNSYERNGQDVSQYSGKLEDDDPEDYVTPTPPPPPPKKK
jgi:hypothetical protein